MPEREQLAQAAARRGQGHASVRKASIIAHDASVDSAPGEAVQEFVKQSFGDEDSANINEISYGDNKVLIEHGKTLFIAAVVSGEGTKRMHEQMKAAVFNIEQDSAQALVKWSGDSKDLRESKKWIKMLIDGQDIEKLTGPSMNAIPQPEELLGEEAKTMPKTGGKPPS